MLGPICQQVVVGGESQDLLVVDHVDRVHLISNIIWHYPKLKVVWVQNITCLWGESEVLATLLRELDDGLNCALGAVDLRALLLDDLDPGWWQRGLLLSCGNMGFVIIT
jgi:hypothetical protein